MKRNAENDGLPKRWRVMKGVYYYSVPAGQESKWEGKSTFRLGKTLSEAHRTWAKRLEIIERGSTIGELLDRYLAEVVPQKAPKTQYDNIQQIRKVRTVFGEMPIEAITPQMIYQYSDMRKAKVAAKREIEVLSHAFSMAVAWGWLNRHPFKGEIRLKGSSTRTRYIEDWEIVECLKLRGHRRLGSIKMIQAYIRLKIMTGMSQGDLLRLNFDENFTEEGIVIQRHKTRNSTGKRTLYSWTPELHEVVELAKSVRPFPDSPWLFCRTDGQCMIDERYGTARSWQHMWQGFMKKLLKTTAVKERFTEHDLRAKCASDADTLEHARALLSHADSKMTERVYRRKPEVVEPLKRGKF